MKQKTVVALLVVAALAAAGVFAVATRGAGKPTPSATAEAGMRTSITKYAVELEPLIPQDMYGKKLNLDRCITLMKTHVARLLTVATTSGIQPMDTGWLYLSGIKYQIRDLHGALPVAWRGKVVYWDVVDGGGDSYTVRAAVQQTLTSARWDAKRQCLVGRKDITYSSAAAREYTMRLVGGVWKVTGVKHWKSYDIPGGLNEGG